MTKVRRRLSLLLRSDKDGRTTIERAANRHVQAGFGKKINHTLTRNKLVRLNSQHPIALDVAEAGAGR